MLLQHQSVVRAAGVGVRLLGFPVLAGLGSSALLILAAWINAALFNELLGQRRPGELAWLAGALGVVLVLRPLVEFLGEIAQNRSGLVVKRNLRRALLAKFEELGPMRSGAGRSGALHSVLTDGIEAVEPYFVKYLSQLVVTVAVALAITVMIGMHSALIAGILLVCGIAVVAIPRIWDRVLAERGREHWDAYENMNSDFIDAMLGMTTLKSFGAAGYYGRQLETQSTRLLDSTLGQLRLSLGETGLSGAMKVLGPAVALVLGIGQIRGGSLTLGSLFLVILLSIELFRPFTALSGLWHESFYGISAASQMSALFRLASGDPRPSGEGWGRPPAGDIEFDNVVYSYPEAGQPALDGASFRIPAGAVTAIVGLSGSGKSTALGLLMGFDRPAEGRIHVGGVDPATIPVERLITLVPQDPLLFPGTVREILAEASPGAGEAQMLATLGTVQAQELRTFETGDMNGILDVKVLERGTNLSGGQKQRLAIARALIRETPVLILDESTSALDSRTEQRLLAGIREKHPGLTLILVTHRIDAASSADHVIVMEHGRVTCQGSPGELLAEPGSPWAGLVTMQTGRETV